MSWNDLQPDPPLSQEQTAVAASLSAELIGKIDAALLGHANKRNRKVAMLVGLTMMDNTLRAPGLPDLYYAQRVKELVRKGLLVAEGNLDYMRYSEVRLP
jgi:hypothetical protein